MTATRPEAIVVRDDSSREDLVEALAHLSFRAAREIHVVGTRDYPTPWDRRHGAIDQLLTQLEATA